jgi:hypothetical protein
MSTQRDNVDPLLEEILTTSTSKEMDPDLAMKFAERMFLKMKEEDAKKKVDDEESRKRSRETKERER